MPAPSDAALAQEASKQGYGVGATVQILFENDKWYHPSLPSRTHARERTRAHRSAHSTSQSKCAAESGRERDRVCVGEGEREAEAGGSGREWVVCVGEGEREAEAGGSGREWVGVMDRVMRVCRRFPGHIIAYTNETRLFTIAFEDGDLQACHAALLTRNALPRKAHRRVSRLNVAAAHGWEPATAPSMTVQCLRDTHSTHTPRILRSTHACRRWSSPTPTVSSSGPRSAPTSSCRSVLPRPRRSVCLPACRLDRLRRVGCTLVLLARFMPHAPQLQSSVARPFAPRTLHAIRSRPE